MFRVSKMADYATLIMAQFASAQGMSLSANDMAELTHIALPTTSKLLKYLSKSNLLISTRGVHGGYQLSRPPSFISLAEILGAVEGSELALTQCCDHGAGQCDIEQSCTMQTHWQSISNAFNHALSSVSLADLCQPSFHKQQHLTDMVRAELTADRQ